MKKGYSILLIGIILSLQSCKETVETPVGFINSDFEEYVERFKTEGSKRGIQLDLSSLSVNYSDTLEYYCGYASEYTIDISKNCWINASDFSKEILIFHELGHAVLGRTHKNSTLPNGSFQSMMIGENQTGVYNQFTTELRGYYLDELFDESTAIPEWGKEKLLFREIQINSSLDINEDGWDFFTVFDDNNDNHRDSAWTDEFASSQEYSLRISSGSMDNPEGFSYWRYNIDPSDIKSGSSLRLKVKIKTDNLVGNGVSIVLRGTKDEPKGFPFLISSEGNQKISDTHDFVEYEITLGYYPNSVDKITIFLLMLPETTGIAYFDDIKLLEYF